MNEFLKDDNWFLWGLQQPWFAWGFGILILFPLAAVALGELINYLENHNSPYQKFAKTLRHLVLPQLVFLVVLTRVFEYDISSTPVRIVETLLYIFVLHAGLMLVDTLLFHDGNPQGWRAKVPKLVADIARAGLVMLGAAIVLSNVWGFDLGQLLAALGVGSIVLGLALQDTLGSLFSGFALLSSKQFSVGDWLDVGNHKGKIITMNWRSVTLLTRDEDIIIVPNSELAKSSFLNYSHPYPRHLERINFDISFDDAPHMVKRILINAALETPGVLHDPKPNCALVSFDEFSIRHELQYFIEDYAQQPKIRDDYMSRVWYIARREGMTFPTRAHEILLSKPGDVIDNSDEKCCEETLQASALLSGRHQKVRQAMVANTRLLCFGKSEKVVEQGQTADALFVIAKGDGLVKYIDNDDETHIICRLEKGDFFGISELVRNERSDVEIIADSDLEVVSLDKEATHKLYEQFPEFAVELSHVITNRHRSIRAIKQEQILLEDTWLSHQGADDQNADTQVIDLDTARKKNAQH